MKINRGIVNKRLVFGILSLAAAAFFPIPGNAAGLSWDAGSHGINTGPTVLAASGNWDLNVAGGGFYRLGQ